MRIAFYAPLKSPDHPVPSGDRLMARLLIEAMRLAGHTVFVASQFRGYAASPEEFAQRRSAGEAAATELVAMWRGATPPESVLLLPSLLQGAGFPRPAPVGHFRHSLCDRRSIVILATPDRTLGRRAGGRRTRAAPCKPQSVLHAAGLRGAARGCGQGQARDDPALHRYIALSLSPPPAQCRPG